MLVPTSITLLEPKKLLVNVKTEEDLVILNQVFDTSLYKVLSSLGPNEDNFSTIFTATPSVETVPLVLIFISIISGKLDFI